MIQGPFPTSAPDTLQVPVPEAFEQWRDLYLTGAFQKAAVLVIFALVLLLVARLARHHLGQQIQDVNRRHVVRKWIGYLYVAAVLAFAVALFADFLSGLGTLVAVVVAGAALALQDVLRSVVGWFYLSGRSGIEIGSRVQIGPVMGDVIDIGVLKTTLMEVGNEAFVHGMQSTGRLISVPNYQMVAESVVVSGSVNPYVWQEVQVAVTFESDWQRAERVLRGIGDELHAEIAAELEAGFRRLERRYAFRYGTLTPIVYVTVAGHGVVLTLRFLVHLRRRRGSEDRVARRLLAELAGDPAIRFAYPTYRLVRGGAETFAGVPRPPAPRSGVEPGAEEGIPPPDLLDE